MTESFNVQSKLTVSTNVEAVLQELIKGFERFDQVINKTQEKLSGLGGAVGKEGEAVRNAFSELKLTNGLKLELDSILGVTSKIATESAAAATAWREMAAAARSMNNGGGGGGPRGPRSGGGGRGGGRGGGGGGGEEGGVTLFGHGDDWANAGWLNRDHDARMSAAERAQSEKFNQDYFLAMRENMDKDIAAKNAERLTQQKFDNDYRLAMRENLDRDIAFKEQERSAQRKFDEDYRAALWEDRNRSAKQKAEADQRFYATHGTPEERRNAEAENRNVNAVALAQKREDSKNHFSSHDWGNAGMGLQMLSQGPLGFFKDSMMKEVGVEETITNLRHNDTISADDLNTVRDRAKEIVRLVEGSKIEDNISLILHAFNLTNDLKASLKAAPAMAEAQVVFEHIPGMHKGDHTFAAMQAEELMQHIYDKKTGEIDVNEMMRGVLAQERVAVGTVGRDKPEDYRSMAKQARAAGITGSDQFLHEDLPAVLIAMGGNRTGTAMTGGYREFIRGTMTAAVSEDLKKIGLLDKSAEWSHGRVRDMEHKFHGYDTMQTNPVEWMREFGLPAMAAHHVDTKDPKAIETALAPLGSTNVVLGWLSELAVGMESINKERDKLRHTDVDKEGKPVSPMAVLREFSPKLKIEAFDAAIDELQVTLGKFMIGPGMEGLKHLTGAIRGLDDFLTHHPDLGKEITVISASLTGLAYALGSLSLIAFAGGPLVGAIKVIGGLGSGLSGFALSLVPFAEGGAVTAALKGLVLGLGTLATGISAAYLALRSKPTVDQKTEDALIGKKDQDPHRFDGFGRPKHDDHGGGVTGYLGRLFDPASYYQAKKPDDLVKSGSSGPTGAAGDPHYVVVQNQISGDDIARGTTARQSSKIDRPPSGYTGSDIRMDALSAYSGMVTAP